jgi:Carbohydrate esterase, sialic acid-specific acetylesterase
MRMLHPAALLASAILFSASLHAAPVRVFLLAGQSNMRGMGNPADLKSPYTESPATVKIWEGKSWVPLVAKGDHFGPEIAFGHAMAKQMPDVEIRLIKHAVSGSNLHTHWAPTTGACYIKFMKVAQTALADLDANKVPYGMAGMLWLQGESDARSPQRIDYERNLTQVIAHMREAFKTPEMPFLIARVREHYGGKAGAKFVRDAQMKMGEADKKKWKIRAEARELAQQGKLAPKEQADYERKRLAEIHTPEEAIAFKGISNQPYHYLGSAKILSRIGEALAEALINRKGNN